MDRRRWKFVLLGAGILVSMALLVVVGMNRSGGFVYYVTVAEYLDHGMRAGDGGFRINGKVVTGSIERLRGGQDVRFAMCDSTDASRKLPVHYSGIIPDTFVDEADVVVEGDLAADGTFRAHTLLAKCPSKYESADGAVAVSRE